MTKSNEPLPNVSGKKNVEREELERFAKMMEEKVINQLVKRTRDRQEEVEKARAWYIG